MNLMYFDGSESSSRVKKSDDIVPRAKNWSPNTKELKMEFCAVKDYCHNINPIVKKCIIGYFTIVLSIFITNTYKNGQKALFDYRSKNKGLVNYESELKAVRDGINLNDYFFKALFFPLSVVPNIVPGIIVFFNRPLWPQ